MSIRKIKGKELGKIKAKTWRELNGYDPLANDVFDYDGLVQKIAELYGLSVEDVEEELTMDELLPLWIEIVNYINAQVFAGLDKIPKNGESGTEKVPQ